MFRRLPRHRRYMIARLLRLRRSMMTPNHHRLRLRPRKLKNRRIGQPGRHSHQPRHRLHRIPRCLRRRENHPMFRQRQLLPQHFQYLMFPDVVGFRQRLMLH